MKIYTKSDLDKYLENDYLLMMLEKSMFSIDRFFLYNQWLIESPVKRMIFNDVYGKIISGDVARNNILDVGGGYSCLTRVLTRETDYTLLDAMTYGRYNDLRKIEREIGSFFIYQDWFDFEPTEKYDYVIANDFFPNVDQRLEMFIEKFLPITKKLVMTLTFYDSDRFYKVKRVDADEIMTMLAWNREMVGDALKNYTKRIEHYTPLVFQTRSKSLFGNGRQVAKVILTGLG